VHADGEKREIWSDSRNPGPNIRHHWLPIFRDLGHQHRAGALQRAQRFAQPTERRQPSPRPGITRVKQNEIKIALEAAMLESIVEHNDIRSESERLTPAANPIRVNDNRNPGKTPRHLERLVTNLVHPLLRVWAHHHHQIPAASSISAAENRGTASKTHQIAHQSDDRRRLAGASKTEVSNRDHRDAETLTTKPPAVESGSSRRDHAPVEGCEG
jgi:hypothetical protein